MKRLSRSRKSVWCASILCVTMLAIPSFMPQTAQADTYSKIVDAQNSLQASAQREQELRSKLSGVNSDLADKIVELDNLNNTQIPAAQQKVEQANADAAAAQSEAEAAAERLKAAQKDKADLEQKIKETGEDYDDSRAAVAQSARESMHGSDTSDLMSVMTGATDSTEFIQQMQSRDALARKEANAASDAAESLSTSMNRSERLQAIEEKIVTLKNDADSASALAQERASQAQSERDALNEKRAQGEKLRSELEASKSDLTDAVAAQAAQQVMLQSQIDSWNKQYEEEQAAAAAQVQQQQPQGTTTPSQSSSSSSKPAQTTKPSTSTTTTPSTPTQTTTPTTPTPATPSGGSSGGQGTSSGDYGNAYAAGQCTWWAYERRKQMGIGTPSYLGNGGQWWATAPSYGLRVDHSPQVGAALSFLPGQEWADGTYGHVAVVEEVGSNYVVISESNVKGLYTITYRTLYNPGRFWYVH